MTEMFMIKSNGGNGTVSNVDFNNFIGHSNFYSLQINSNWSGQVPVEGDGVLFTDIGYDNWKGDCMNGTMRGPIQILCPSEMPCGDITITDFAMWTDDGTEEYFLCSSASGDGGCLSGETVSGTTTSTVTAAPSGFSAATMPSDLASSFPLSESIPIPAIPTTFFPGATPVSALLG